MANTYTSIYIHLVFAVKHREAMLVPVYRPRIFQYMCGILHADGHEPVAIGGTDNHVHLLIKYNINKLIPDMVRDLKANASKFVNQELVFRQRFEWQRGYGAFSVSPRDVEPVVEYIKSQPEHHNNMTLEQEVKTMLDRCGIPYEDKYLFYDA